MKKVYQGRTVFDAALDRIIELYKDDHTVVVSFSGGKDSGVCLELAIIAATITKKLPVKAVMRDEEIMCPGTFEYCERTAERSEVEFHWLYANQPVVNVYNRQMPYFWVFDPLLDPDKWVRKPPSYAKKMKGLSIAHMCTPEMFPVLPGKKLVSITGITVHESMTRRMAIYSSRGYLTVHPCEGGAYLARPIYDWTDGDVWKAIADNKWDYNTAYDVMAKHGLPRNRLRIAPPTLSNVGYEALKVEARAFPGWFNKVCDRLPGVRSAVNYGKKALFPLRRASESWQECFQRTCVDEAPEWIAKRAVMLRDFTLRSHHRHSTIPLQDVKTCERCLRSVWSWKTLTASIYNGDPFISRVGGGTPLKPVEPSEFREGAGEWEGKPTF